MKVSELILLLQQLPPSAPIYTSGLEGVYLLEPGNLCPFKVLETKFGVVLYIDDGISANGNGLLDTWEPIDEYVTRKLPAPPPGAA